VDVAKFFLYMLSLFLVTLSASGFAFFFSASVRIFAVANLCIALCYVFMMVSVFLHLGICILTF